MQDESISLREYFDNRIENIEKNTELARVAIEKRLEGMNEFRDQLRDQASSFMTREYYEARHSMLQKQVDELMLNRAVLDAKASNQSVNRALIISIIGIILGVVGILEKFIK